MQADGAISKLELVESRYKLTDDAKKPPDFVREQTATDKLKDRKISFNTNAVPFIPSFTSDPGPSVSSGTDAGSNGGMDDDTDVDEEQHYSDGSDEEPVLIYINNLPPDCTEDDLVQLIEQFDPECQFGVVSFQPLSYMAPANDLNSKQPEFINSVVEISSFQTAMDLINNYNRYQWDDNILEINFVPPFYPFNFMYPPQLMSQSPFPMFPSPIPPPNTGAATNPYMVPSPSLFPPGMMLSQMKGTMNNMGTNKFPGSYHHYNSRGNYNYHYNHSNRGGSKNLSQTSIPPPMSRFSSRSDSNSDLAKASGGSTSNSTSHTNSFSNSSSVTTASTLSANNNPSGVPQFLMNFVNSNDSKQLPLSLSTPEFMVVKDEEGNPIKVNPCRLFVGNIPFSSTWANLKNFILAKCKEFEPDNNIEVLRVEIPMHTTPSSANSTISNTSSRSNSRLNSFQFLTLDEASHENSLSHEPESPRTESSTITDTSQPQLTPQLQPTPQHQGYQKPLSRGFAIVTTGNKESAEKIIKYFDGIEFEGRILTVRFDKFPDYNNYVLQQLYPNQLNKEKALTNLAFERNSLQQKFYYGNSFPNSFYGNQRPHSHSHSNSNHGSFSHGLGNLSRSNSHTGQLGPNGMNMSNYYGNQNARNRHKHGSYSNYHHEQKHSQHHLHNQSHLSSPKFPILQPNFIPQIHPSAHYINNMNIPRSDKRRLVPQDKTSLESTGNVDEAEKARELVNSFKSLGISS